MLLPNLQTTVNISDFVKANAAYSYLNASTGTQATERSGGSVRGLQKAEQRIQAQVDSTSAQLSSLGKLKSTVSEVQSSARALANPPSTSKFDDTKAALTNLVAAFNTAVDRTSTAGNAANDAATRQSAGRVSQSLARAVTSDKATLSALGNAGISTNAQGKLSVDTAKLAAVQSSNPGSLKDTLGKLGRQVEQATTRELALDGSVGNPIAALNQRAFVLKSQQTTLASLQPSTVKTAASSFSARFGSGLSGYQNS